MTAKKNENTTPKRSKERNFLEIYEKTLNDLWDLYVASGRISQPAFREYCRFESYIRHRLELIAIGYRRSDDRKSLGLVESIWLDIPNEDSPMQSNMISGPEWRTNRLASMAGRLVAERGRDFLRKHIAVENVITHERGRVKVYGLNYMERGGEIMEGFFVDIDTITKWWPSTIVEIPTVGDDLRGWGPKVGSDERPPIIRTSERDDYVPLKRKAAVKGGRPKKGKG